MHPRWRCLGLKRECSWPEPRPRPKRPRTSTSRISHVEEKLDGLVALLGTARHENASPAPDQPSQPTPHHSFHRDSPPPVILESPRSEDAAPAPIEETQLSPPPSLVEEGTLHEFRNLLSFFPFVYLPSDVTAHALRTRRPHLFQAIQLITSSTSHPLQVAFEEQFRRAIAESIFMEAQKNLDVLQSLEVYLAWYHFHFKPQSQQIYQLLGLVVSMVIDLGYHSQKRRARIDISGSHSDHPIGSAEEREIQRAFLGCYYLSSACVLI